MGFTYRKSLKAGPFRVTASKSGISYSAGVKGARVTKRANGKVQTTLSAPGTGLRYTTTSGTRKRQAKRPAASTPPSARRPAPGPQAAGRPSPAAAPNAVPAPRAARTGSQRDFAAGGPPHLPGFPPRGCCPSPSTATLPQLPSTKAASISSGRAPAGSTATTQPASPGTSYAGIDFLEPNFFRNGHVHFATFDDPRGLTSTGNGNRMAASARNPHAILFAWHQSHAYWQLRDLLTGGGAVPPPSS